MAPLTKRWLAGIAVTLATLTAVVLPGTAQAARDRKPPTTPTNLQTQTVSFTWFNLSWNPSTDNSGTVMYDVTIHRAGTVESQRAFTNSQGFGGLEAGATYTASVSAVDVAGNRSATVSIQVTTLPRTQPPPSTPTNLRGVFVDGVLHSIAWDASTHNQPVSYVGYSGSTSLFSTWATSIRIFELVHHWCAVDPGGTVTLTIQAIGSDNYLSGFSAPVTFTIPAAGSIRP
jgi:hypothetical protein